MKKLLFLLPLLAFVFLAFSNVKGEPPNDVGIVKIVMAQDADSSVIVLNDFVGEKNSDLLLLKGQTVLNQNTQFQLGILSDTKQVDAFDMNSSDNFVKKPPVILFYRYIINRNQENIYRNSLHLQIGYSLAS